MLQLIGSILGIAKILQNPLPDFDCFTIIAFQFYATVKIPLIEQQVDFSDDDRLKSRTILSVSGQTVALTKKQGPHKMEALLGITKLKYLWEKNVAAREARAFVKENQPPNFTISEPEVNSWFFFKKGQMVLIASFGNHVRPKAYQIKKTAISGQFAYNSVRSLPKGVQNLFIYEQNRGQQIMVKSHVRPCNFKPRLPCDT